MKIEVSKKYHVSEKDSRRVREFIGTQMRGEIMFLATDININIKEKKYNHNRVLNGYLEGLDKREIPYGWDVGTLKMLAGWIRDNPPRVSITTVIDSMGDESPSILIQYPTRLPYFKCFGFENDIDAKRSRDWTWLKIK
jgi:hypothetical protein